MKLLYNEEESFFTKTKLLDFKVTLPLAKVDMVSSRLLLNGFIFSGDIPVSMQLVTFLLLSNVSKLSVGAKTKKFW